MSSRDGVNRMIGTLHRTAYRLSKGRVGGRMRKAPVLLLTTTGRRTGKERTWPVIYLEDHERYLVVASNAGQDRDPAWYLNLLDHPDVEVEIDRRRQAMVAKPLTIEERERVWPRLVAMYGGFDIYRRKTSRAIPVVALTPRSGH